jgi:hypothetical protein
MKKTLKGKRFAYMEEATASCFGSSRDASQSGKKDWTTVLPPVESILKGIKRFLFKM